MGADQIPTLTGDWKKLISTLMGDFKEFEGSVEDVTADVMEIARELELEPQDGRGLLPPPDQTWAERLLTGEQRKWFLEVDSVPGKDAHTYIIINQSETRRKRTAYSIAGTSKRRGQPALPRPLRPRDLASTSKIKNVFSLSG